MHGFGARVILRNVRESIKELQKNGKKTCNISKWVRTEKSVYNCDGIGLFNKVLPDRTLTFKEEIGAHSEKK